jgi:hypothetical protein
VAGLLDLVNRAEAGLLTVAEGEAFDNAFASMGAIQTVALIATAVAYLAWLHLSIENTPGLGGGVPSVTPRWSVIWWFIPFANLVKPYQVVADLYRRMAPRLDIGVGLVLVWWLFWVVSNLVSNLGGITYGRAETIAALREAFEFYSYADLGDAVAAVLAIAVVLRIQHWADQRSTAAPTAVETAQAVPAPEPAE